MDPETKVGPAALPPGLLLWSPPLVWLFVAVFKFYWHIVNLQCCISFCYITKQVSYTDM